MNCSPRAALGLSAILSLALAVCGEDSTRHDGGSAGGATGAGGVAGGAGGQGGAGGATGAGGVAGGAGGQGGAGGAAGAGGQGGGVWNGGGRGGGFGGAGGQGTVPVPPVDSARSSIQRITDPQVTTADSSQLASDNAAFAFDVYNKLVATNSNVVFSPLSISIALAMTYAGAAGTTASEMASTLHFSLPPARLHAAFNALDLALTSRGQGWPVKINVVNALWADKTLTFKSDFLDTLAANYGAGVNLLDFINAPDPSRQTINAWVASQTNNKIQDLLPVGSISDQTRLVLTNAIYLDATWHVFDHSTTVSRSFTRLDGSGVTVKFMDVPIAYLLANRATNFVAASLPYANPDLSLVVVVPDLGKFAEVESSLNATTLATLMAGMTTQSVGVYLPRFQIKTAAGLAETLRALGMKSAFDGTANFLGMSDELGLHIADVIHQAFISVAEAGTEAAAATGVIIGGSSGQATPTPALILDASRPFLYFLRDQPTGAIVFMGRVMDPSAN